METCIWGAIALILKHYKSRFNRSGVTGGGGGGRGQGAECPQRFLTGKFLLTYREKEAREKGENWDEKKENCKREGGKFEMEVGKVIKRGEVRTFVFVFVFHFWKRRKFVMGLPKWEFCTRKKTLKKKFHAGKKIGKICLLRPCLTASKKSTIHFFMKFAQFGEWMLWYIL